MLAGQMAGARTEAARCARQAAGLGGFVGASARSLGAARRPSLTVLHKRQPHAARLPRLEAQGRQEQPEPPPPPPPLKEQQPLQRPPQLEPQRKDGMVSSYHRQQVAGLFPPAWLATGLGSPGRWLRLEASGIHFASNKRHTGTSSHSWPWLGPSCQATRKPGPVLVRRKWCGDPQPLTSAQSSSSDSLP